MHDKPSYLALETRPYRPLLRDRYLYTDPKSVFRFFKKCLRSPSFQHRALRNRLESGHADPEAASPDCADECSP